MEEGTHADVPAAEIGLVVGQPVSFRFFRSSTRKSDQPGLKLQKWGSELSEVDPLTATLTMDSANQSYVPVKFDSRITELGMFELWCEEIKPAQTTTGQASPAPHDSAAENDGGEPTDDPSEQAPHRWKLEFNVREDE
jgi:hypothetical protein